MNRSDIESLTLLQLKFLVCYSRFLVWVYHWKHISHAALGVYPLRRKFIIRLLRTRIHLTVSVESNPSYHWIGGSTD